MSEAGFLRFRLSERWVHNSGVGFRSMRPLDDYTQNWLWADLRSQNTLFWMEGISLDHFMNKELDLWGDSYQICIVRFQFEKSPCTADGTYFRHKAFFWGSVHLERSPVYLRVAKKLCDSPKIYQSMIFLLANILVRFRFLVNLAQIENLNTQNLIAGRSHSFFATLGMYPEQSVYREEQFESSFWNWVPPNSCAIFRNTVFKRFRRPRSHTT